MKRAMDASRAVRGNTNNSLMHLCELAERQSTIESVRMGGDATEVIRIIETATAESPQIFAYAELLNCEALQALQGTTNEPYLQLLNIFAFGTLCDYMQQKDAGRLPNIGSEQRKKLRQLTVLTMARESKVRSTFLLFFYLGF